MFRYLLKKIAEGLNQLNIPYMIIGGQAVLFYGEPRLTRDIDVTLGADPGKLPEVLNWIRSEDWQVLVKDAEDFVRRTMVLPVQEPENKIRIDLIFSFSPYEQQAMKRVRKIKFDDVEVNFASPEDVIIHKIIAGRPRDIEDVESILRKHSDIDHPYIIHWLKQFEAAFNQNYVSQFQRIVKKI